MRRKTITITACIAAIMLMITACGSVKFDTLSTGSGGIEDLKTNMVKIENRTEDGMLITGTGFFTKDGALTTTSNIVDVPGRITVTYSNGSSSHAELVSNNIQSNMALLKVDNVPVQAVAYASGGTQAMDGETMKVIGYPADKNKAEVFDVAVRRTDRGDGTMILILTPGLPQSFDGALVVDAYGNVAGQVTLANSRLDYALASTAETVENEVSSLAKNQKTETFETSYRENVYVDYVDAQGDEAAADVYLPDDYLKGETTTSSGVYLRVAQQNGPLVKILYDTTGCQDEIPFVLEGDTQPVAIATTDSGEFRFPLTRISLSKEKIGDIPLYFDGLDGVIRSITLQGVSGEDQGKITLTLSGAVEKPDLKTELENDEELMVFLGKQFGYAFYNEETINSVLEWITILPYEYGAYQFLTEQPEEGKIEDSYYSNSNLNRFAYGGGVPEDEYRQYVQFFYNVTDAQFDLFKQEMIGVHSATGYSDTQQGYYDGKFGPYNWNFGPGMYKSRKILGITAAEEKEGRIIIDYYGVANYIYPEQMQSVDLPDYAYGTPIEELPRDYLLQYRAVLEKKTKDGKTYWTAHSITPIQ